MKTSSPLRYPGGKSSMAGLLSEIRRLNGLGNRSIAEPFAGGAGASLSLLFLEEAREIYINDADPAIFNFWWALINRPLQFLDLLTKTRINMDEWRRQRDIYRKNNKTSKLKKGFSAFYLNRCNRSGIIINGGPIGGLLQDGKWKLDARFNKSELHRRCAKVAEYRDRIHISCDDGLNFIEKCNLDSVFFFIDPPYIEKGSMLYLNTLNDEYHAILSAHLKTIRDASWILTYNDCPEIRRMYSDWAVVQPFSQNYTAAERRTGREILITPRWMRLPSRRLTLV